MHTFRVALGPARSAVRPPRAEQGEPAGAQAGTRFSGRTGRWGRAHAGCLEPLTDRATRPGSSDVRQLSAEACVLRAGLGTAS
jgi:hypothetical protein